MVAWEEEMIGPKKQKIPDKKICGGCDVLISREFGGTERFPKKWTVFYCNHPNLSDDPSVKVQYIGKNKPWTPKWCPA
jgi:hypothetical protein